jgi:hypothetical protein
MRYGMLSRAVRVLGLCGLLVGVGLRAKPVGLPNVGATCWMNALLQSIMGVEPLCERLLAIPENEQKDDVRAFIALIKACRAAALKGESSVARSFVEEMRAMFMRSRPQMAEEGGADQDIGEGLALWLDYSDREELHKYDLQIGNSFYDLCWFYEGFLTASQFFTANQPVRLPERYDPEIYVMVKPGYKGATLTEKIGADYESVMFFGKEQWYDERQKKHVDAEQKRYIVPNQATGELPEFFMVNFARYDPFNQSHWKKSIPVDFEIDIAPWVLPGIKKQDTAYLLVSVAEYTGGHYYAYVKDLSDPKRPWYECNDSTVTPIIDMKAMKEDIENRCSLLIYRKKTSETLSIENPKQKSELDKKLFENFVPGRIAQKKLAIEKKAIKGEQGQQKLEKPLRDFSDSLAALQKQLAGIKEVVVDVPRMKALSVQEKVALAAIVATAKEGWESWSFFERKQTRLLRVMGAMGAAIRPYIPSKDSQKRRSQIADFFNTLAGFKVLRGEILAFYRLHSPEFLTSIAWMPKEQRANTDLVWLICASATGKFV